MKVGVQLPEVEYEIAWPALIEMARTAEAVGFDSIWLGDHLLYDLPGLGPRGPWEVWTSLAALAAVTDRVELGPLVACAGFHAPAMLAKQAATVDAISGGRLILGLGAGWNEREYTAFGFPYDHRLDRFAEAFEITATLLREGRCTFNGRYHAVDDCVLHPPPARVGGPSIMIGSWRPRMLGIAASCMSAWNIWWSDYGNDVAGFTARKAQVDATLAGLGRDPATVEATAAVYVQAPGGGGRRMGSTEGRTIEPVSGGPADVAGHLRAMAAAGAAHVQLVVDPITKPSIEWLAEALAILRRG